jgi:hypothetical protein
LGESRQIPLALRRRRCEPDTVVKYQIQASINMNSKKPTPAAVSAAVGVLPRLKIQTGKHFSC